MFLYLHECDTFSNPLKHQRVNQIYNSILKILMQLMHKFIVYHESISLSGRFDPYFNKKPFDANSQLKYLCKIICKGWECIIEEKMSYVWSVQWNICCCYSIHTDGTDMTWRPQNLNMHTNKLAFNLRLKVVLSKIPSYSYQLSWTKRTAKSKSTFMPVGNREVKFCAWHLCLKIIILIGCI